MVVKRLHMGYNYAFMTTVDRIKSLMETKRINKAQLVELSGLKTATVYALFYETRANENVRPDTLVKIAEALNTSVDYLLTGKQNYDIGRISAVKNLSRGGVEINEATIKAYNDILCMADALTESKLSSQIQEISKVLKSLETPQFASLCKGLPATVKPASDAYAQLLKCSELLQTLINAKRLQELSERLK
jgi:transcriptional regulator with XRE-family HTH domain